MAWHYAKRILFSAALLACALVLMDVGAGAMGLADAQLKVQVFTDADDGHCYSSDARGSFPIALEETADREKFAKKVRTYRHTSFAGAPLKPADVAYLRAHTPDCVIYDRRSRRHGFFPGRARTVALVGDSFTQGEGVKDQDTLGYLLGQRYREVNFQTVGIPGGNIAVLAESLRLYLRDPAAARTVIYLYNLNDVLVRDGVDHSTLCTGEVNVLEPGLLHTAGGWSNLAFVLHRHRRHHARTARIVGGYLSTYQDARNQRYVEDTFKILRSMVRLVRARGGVLHLVIYPVPYKVDGVYPFEPIHRLVMKRCRRTGASCVDGLEGFRGTGRWARFRVHPADSHPNGEANRVMVELLARKLKIR